MEKEKRKILHTELKGNLATRFDLIKSTLGIQNDAEVVRYLIQNYFRNSMEDQRITAREGIEKDREVIKKFMEKYGEEWKKLGED
ncbi:hypothetical protein LCGC14_1691410 [marine sediment metagenome]|uniref:Uncharacterized protein n=1 Tax=marine sediment metagenome TaxID=412755 RepID=A0A0F9I8B1_9ZZZZ|nr:hypothetical protein [archaeon]